MNRKWEVDVATTVEAHFGSFGRFSSKVITVNGKEVHNSRSLRTKGEIAFSLPDGRPAAISVKPELVGSPMIDLRVDGHVIIATDKQPIKCRACGAEGKPYDRICRSCGEAMPTVDEYLHQKHVKDASDAIRTVAVLFLIFGIIMFFATKVKTNSMLAKLDGLDPDSVFPSPVEGVTYTVAALRDQMALEQWIILIVYLIVAAFMAGLSIWGRRAPIPAVLVATASCLAIILAGSGGGKIAIIIIMAFLIKGMKAIVPLLKAKHKTHA